MFLFFNVFVLFVVGLIMGGYVINELLSDIKICCVGDE